ncbi:MAG: cyclic-di-AMP receptor [Anaerolineae bacterium]|nr:cyclic-di-AMP receptor [Anaerolineae bacterium]
MKLVVAVVQDLDADDVIEALTEAEYRVTRVASTGGFFRQGNTTLFCGVADDRVSHLISLLRKTCKRRSRMMPIAPHSAEHPMTVGAYVEVTVGGATIFVLDVEDFEQI